MSFFIFYETRTLKKNLKKKTLPGQFPGLSLFEKMATELKVNSKYQKLNGIFVFSQLQEANSLWDWAKLISNWEENMIYTKNYQILSRKMISTLTGFKVSSLASKCVFYRPEHSAKRRPLK